MSKPRARKCWERSARRPSRPCTTAFTLIETLIVISIIALLLALLMPALRLTRSRAQTLNCASNLRSVAMRFQLFADNTDLGGRGDSEQLGANRFHINDFLDSLYRLDEFWDLGSAQEGTLNVGSEPGMCPAGAPRLVRRAGFPCGPQALQPVQDVSFAVNMRLYRGHVAIGGQILLAPVSVTYVRSDILSHPYVPLIMDTDGEEAARRRVDPFYAAPPVPGESDQLSSGHYWMPPRRHPGGMNVALVGGQVIRSAAPEKEAWNWSYSASVGN